MSYSLVSVKNCTRLYLDVVFVSCLDEVRHVCLLSVELIRIHELHQRPQGRKFHILQIMKNNYWRRKQALDRHLERQLGAD